MSVKKTKGKSLPKLDPSSISTAFFSTSSETLLKAVSQGTEKIEELTQNHETIPSQTITEKNESDATAQKTIIEEGRGEVQEAPVKTENTESIKEQTGEIEEHTPQRGRPRKNIETASHKTALNAEKLDRKANTENSLISFLKEEGRSNTRPVRLLESNYRRVFYLKKHFNSTKSVSELIDFILGDYLDKVEKKLEKIVD